MCGIFGIFDNNKSDMFYELGKLSESRGKEASGLMVLDGSEISIKKYSSFQVVMLKNILKTKNLVINLNILDIQGFRPVVVVNTIKIINQ